VAQRFHLDSVEWYRRTEFSEILPSLAAAVWREHRIRIRYESWKDLVVRELEPLGLVLKGGTWYLVAAAKKQPRTYRVSNIQDLEVLPESFERPARFDLERFWETWSKEFEARLMDERARVRLSPAGRRMLRQVSPAAAEALAAQLTGEPEGWIEADIPIETLEQASRQLLRLGVEVEVLGPPELRSMITELIGRLARVYGAT
jgi:predicted DNA-binding transcriptional regulator YafY